jgi:hypothetical protein
MICSIDGGVRASDCTLSKGGWEESPGKACACQQAPCPTGYAGACIEDLLISHLDGGVHAGQGGHGTRWGLSGQIDPNPIIASTACKHSLQLSSF